LEEPGKSYSAQAGVLQQSSGWSVASAKTWPSLAVAILIVAERPGAERPGTEVAEVIWRPVAERPGERPGTQVAERTGLNVVSASCVKRRSLAAGRRPVAMTVLAMNSKPSAPEKKTEVTGKAGPIVLTMQLAKRKVVVFGRMPRATTVLSMVDTAASVGERRTPSARRTAALQSAVGIRKTTASALAMLAAAIAPMAKRTTAAVAVGRRTTAVTVGRPEGGNRTLTTWETRAAAITRQVEISEWAAKQSTVAGEEWTLKVVAAPRITGPTAPQAETVPTAMAGVLNGKEVVVRWIPTVAASLAVDAAAAVAATAIEAADAPMAAVHLVLENAKAMTHIAAGVRRRPQSGKGEAADAAAAMAATAIEAADALMAAVRLVLENAKAMTLIAAGVRRRLQSGKGAAADAAAAVAATAIEAADTSMAAVHLAMTEIAAAVRRRPQSDKGAVGVQAALAAAREVAAASPRHMLRDGCSKRKKRKRCSG